MPTAYGLAVTITTMKIFGRFGPGILVTAAFIGPGTITTASLAGANFGFALLWALLFSIIATIVLQEMCARLGLVTRAGLAEAMRGTFHSKLFGRLSVLLVVAAVGFGNAAYEAGNISGAALAIDSVTNVGRSSAAVALGLLSAVLLGTGLPYFGGRTHRSGSGHERGLYPRGNRGSTHVNGCAAVHTATYHAPGLRPYGDCLDRYHSGSL